MYALQHAVLCQALYASAPAGCCVLCISWLLRISAACPAFPLMYSKTLGDPACVRSVFQHGAQSALAHTLYKMKVRRARLLGLTMGI
jgi:hypothetical protein